MKKIFFVILMVFAFGKSMQASEADFSHVTAILEDFERERIEALHELLSYQAASILINIHASNKEPIIALIEAGKIKCILDEKAPLNGIIGLDNQKFMDLRLSSTTLLDGLGASLQKVIAEAGSRLISSSREEIAELYKVELVCKIHQKMSKALFCESKEEMKKIFLKQFNEGEINSFFSEEVELSDDDVLLLRSFPSYMSEDELEVLGMIASLTLGEPKIASFRVKCARFLLLQALHSFKQNITETQLGLYKRALSGHTMEYLMIELVKARRWEYPSMPQELLPSDGSGCNLF